MTKRRVFSLAGAAIIAIIMVIIVHSMLQPTDTNGTVAVVAPTTEILAAARDLPTGSIIKESDVKWIPWATDAETTKLYVKGKIEVSTLVGGVLREGLHAEEPILTGRIVQPHEQGFLAAVLTPGLRAISVTLSPSGEVAGFIFPGDRVDVILTHSFKIKNDKGDYDQADHSVSETVVQDARILALDQKSDDQTTDPKVAQLATLEVTPKQAERLALAVDMAGMPGTGKGSISLVLRSLAAETENGVITPVPDTGKPTAKTGVTMDSDVSPALSAVPTSHEVHVMRGKDQSKTIFQNQKY